MDIAIFTTQARAVTIGLATLCGTVVNISKEIFQVDDEYLNPCLYSISHPYNAKT